VEVGGREGLMVKEGNEVSNGCRLGTTLPQCERKKRG